MSGSFVGAPTPNSSVGVGHNEGEVSSSFRRSTRKRKPRGSDDLEWPPPPKNLMRTIHEAGEEEEDIGTSSFRRSTRKRKPRGSDDLEWPPPPKNLMRTINEAGEEEEDSEEEDSEEEDSEEEDLEEEDIGTKLAAIEKEKKRNQSTDNESTDDDEAMIDNETIDDIVQNFPAGGGSESEDDINSTVTAADNNIPTNSNNTNTNPTALNMLCKKVISQKFPIVAGRGRLQPPPNYLISVDELKRFRSMSQAEQREVKSMWAKLTAAEKLNVKNKIPGFKCTCCVRKQRCDKGTTRGQNARSQQTETMLTQDDAPESIEQAAPYASIGGDEDGREQHTIKPKPKQKRQNIRSWQYAKSVQQCGGEKALLALHGAHKSFGQALTCCSQKPPFNSELNCYEYPSLQTAPRVIGLQVVVNYIQETKSTGSTLSPNQLRAAKPTITYVSTSREDAELVLAALKDAGINKDKYNKVKHFGTGDAMKSSLRRFYRARKASRSKGRKSAATMAESQREIPASLSQACVVQQPSQATTQQQC